MLPRALALTRVARVASRFQPVRCGSDVALHGPSEREIAEQQLSTMDHITVPQGSWHADYQKRQARYNRNLLVNLVIFGVMWAWIAKSGAVIFYGAPDVSKVDPFVELPKKDEE